jgi:Amt family ammonium transporter
VGHNRVAINMVWTLITGYSVMFMQAGFAIVETGLARAKNANHTMMMNLVIFALGAAGWWICGYAFMFGSTANPVLGLTALGNPIHIGSWNILASSGFFLGGKAYDVSVMAFFFFQLVFMDATATIPTGAMAERWKFTSFCVWGLFASMILYPLYGNWVWGGGWLSQLGAQGPQWGHGALDFAGSGVVHAMGGVAAFWGAKALGPRIGKYAKDGTPRAIPGHHIPMAFLGGFVLLVGWMGFNGASTFAATDFRFTVVITNTILSSAAGCLTALAIVWKKYGNPDPSMTVNGLLAGLVAITAPCAFVAPWAAVLIGIVSGFVVVYTVLIVDKKLKVDDPVGAVAVHGTCGLWGVLALGLLADGKYGDGLNGVTGPVKGLFYGDTGQFLAQLTSVIVLVAWCSIACIVFFGISNKTMGMRVTEEQEVMGLNAGEMGEQAYPDFMEAPDQGPHASEHEVGAGSPA